MNDKMLDMIGLADEKYLLEAEETHTRRKIRHHRKISAGLIAAIVAGVSLVSVASATVYKSLVHKESVEKYGISVDESTNSELIIGTTSAENAHLRLTADTVLSDGIKVNMIFTLEALDDEGKDFMNTNNKRPLPTMFYSTDLSKSRADFRNDRQSKALNMANPSKLSEDGSCSFMFTQLFTDGNPGKIYLFPEDYRVTGDGASVFDGIILEIDVSKNIQVREFTHSTNKLYLSKIGATVIKGDNDEPLGLAADGEFSVVYRDGTKEGLHDSFGYSIVQEDIGQTFMHRVIDLDKVEYVIWGSIEYR